ncbi:MAG: hypothetical protein ACJAYC_001403 [Halieaceae bacterium]|jgi:hypothetical protein
MSKLKRALNFTVLLGSTAVLLQPLSGRTETSEKYAYYGETHIHAAPSLDTSLGGTRQTPLALSHINNASKGLVFHDLVCYIV